MFLDKHFWPWMVLKTHICFPVFLLFTLIVEPSSKIGIGWQSCSLFSVEGYQGHNRSFSSFQSLNCTSNLNIGFELWEIEGAGGSPKKSELGCETWNCYVITAVFLIGKNLFPSSEGGKKPKDRLEKSEGMRHFSPHSVTFLQSRSSRELPCPDDSPDWNSHIT